MEALNHTQLASVVLALSVAFGLLLIICLRLIWRTIQIQNDFMKEDEALYTKFKGCKSELEEKLANSINSAKINHNNYIDSKIAKLKNELIKPKFAIGDRIVCSDGTRGTITDIEPTNGSFCYTYKTRKYFSNPAKTLKTTEYGILGLS